jgi:hypothetical protein
VSTIREEYDKLYAKEWARHKEKVKKLREWLYAQQEKCPKHKWVRDEHLFFFNGETYPGDYCTECGKKRKVGSQCLKLLK